RRYGQISWDGKPGGMVSVSIGNISGFGANHHLRQSLVFVNVATMTQPEAYIGRASELFDENGELTSESTRGFLKTYIEAFAKWVENFHRESSDQFFLAAFSAAFGCRKEISPKYIANSR